MGVHEEIEAEKDKARAFIEAGKYCDAAKHLYADHFISRMRGTLVDSHQGRRRSVGILGWKPTICAGIAAVMARINDPKTVVSRTDSAKTYEMGPEHAHQVGHAQYHHKDGKVTNVWSVWGEGGGGLGNSQQLYITGVHDELEAVKKAAKELMAQKKYLDAFKCMYADDCVMAMGGVEPIRGREGRNNHAHIHFYSFMHISSRCGRNGKARSGRRRT
ncbi:unnamed protein product [Sphagnum balticum]